MPKVYNTRKQRARELYERLRRGPSLSPHAGRGTYTGLTVAEAERQVRGWLGSWITYEVIDLVPELKHLRGKNAKDT